MILDVCNETINGAAFGIYWANSHMRPEEVIILGYYMLVCK